MHLNDEMSYTTRLACELVNDHSWLLQAYCCTLRGQLKQCAMVSPGSVMGWSGLGSGHHLVHAELAAVLDAIQTDLDVSPTDQSAIVSTSVGQVEAMCHVCPDLVIGWSGPAVVTSLVHAKLAK